MTTAYSVIRILTNSADQTVTTVELTTNSMTSAYEKYYEVLADAVVKANAGRLADGAYIINNVGGVQEKMVFNAPEQTSALEE